MKTTTSHKICACALAAALLCALLLGLSAPALADDPSSDRGDTIFIGQDVYGAVLYVVDNWDDVPNPDNFDVYGGYPVTESDPLSCDDPLEKSIYIIAETDNPLDKDFAIYLDKLNLAEGYTLTVAGSKGVRIIGAGSDSQFSADYLQTHQTGAPTTDYVQFKDLQSFSLGSADLEGSLNITKCANAYFSGQVTASNRLLIAYSEVVFDDCVTVDGQYVDILTSLVSFDGGLDGSYNQLVCWDEPGILANSSNFWVSVEGDVSTGTLGLYPSTYSSNSTISMEISGSLNVSTLLLEARSTLTVEEDVICGTLRAAGTFTVDGDMIVTAPTIMGTTHVKGDFQTTSTLTVEGGSLTVDGQFSAGAITINRGNLFVTGEIRVSQLEFKGSGGLSADSLDMDTSKIEFSSNWASMTIAGEIKAGKITVTDNNTLRAGSITATEISMIGGTLDVTGNVVCRSGEFYATRGAGNIRPTVTIGGNLTAERRIWFIGAASLSVSGNVTSNTQNLLLFAAYTPQPATLSIGGNLTVRGSDNTLNASVHVSQQQRLVVGGDITVLEYSSGGADYQKSYFIGAYGGSISAGGNISTPKFIECMKDGEISADGDIRCGGYASLSHEGMVTAGGDFIIGADNTAANRNLSLDNIYALDITGKIGVSGNLTTDDDMQVDGGGLEVAGNAEIGGVFTANGPAVVRGNLTTPEGAVFVAGYTSVVGGTVAAAGDYKIHEQGLLVGGLPVVSGAYPYIYDGTATQKAGFVQIEGLSPNAPFAFPNGRVAQSGADGKLGVWLPANNSLEVADFTLFGATQPLAVVYDVAVTLSGVDGVGAATARPVYTVSFDAQGGSAVADVEIASGIVLNAPTNPSRPKYRFAGWYTDSSCTQKYDFSQMVISSFTLYAKWSVSTSSGDSGGSTATLRQPETPDITGGLNVTTPEGQPPLGNPNGGVTLPGGGTLTTDDGTVIQLPPGSIIGPDGKVTVGAGGAPVRLANGSHLRLAAGTALIIDVNMPLGFSIAGQLPFNDVKRGDWFYDYVVFNYFGGLFNGTTAATFSPHSTMTRAMMVTVLWRLAGSPPPNGGLSFTDIAADAYYAQAVAWAAENGIVQGLDDGNFAPDAAITRQQMATMLNNYARYMGLNLPRQREGSFADEARISLWAREAAVNMYAAGILDGRGQGNFEPQATATRAEVAAMLTRFIETAK